jgi:hypothetical protein
MAKMVKKKCRCGIEFEARLSDIKRGWGKYCSKSCKAKRQTQDRFNNSNKNTVAGGSWSEDQDWENGSIMGSVEESQTYGI